MRNRLFFTLIVIISALFFLTPAILNHYPIVFSDTGEHIASGFEMYFPGDRPITYGIFLRYFSFDGTTLWTVVITQALLFSYLMAHLYKLIFGARGYFAKGLLINIVLTLFTGIAW